MVNKAIRVNFTTDHDSTNREQNNIYYHHIMLGNSAMCVQRENGSLSEQKVCQDLVLVCLVFHLQC